MVSRVSESTGRCTACGNDLRAKARFCDVCGSPVAVRRAAGIGGWVTRRAFLSGDRVALIDGDSRITYTEFDRRTDQLARALREFGVRQGDRVAALLVNSAAFLETMFATAKLGAVFVPINFRLTAPEVAFLLADSGADVFVWSSHLSSLARAALAGEGVRVRARVVVAGEPADGETDFEQVLASGEPRACGRATEWPLCWSTAPPSWRRCSPPPSSVRSLCPSTSGWLPPR